MIAAELMTVSEAHDADAFGELHRLVDFGCTSRWTILARYTWITGHAG